MLLKSGGTQVVSPPIACRHETLRRRPGVTPGRGTVFQAGVCESLREKKEKKTREQLIYGKHQSIEIVVVVKENLSVPSTAILLEVLDSGKEPFDS